MTFVVVELSEAAWVCSTGGGFSRRTWSVAAPDAAGVVWDPSREDAWLNPQTLADAPPPGFATSLSATGVPPISTTIPPGCVWRRLFTVTVPVGHRLRCRVSHPDRERAAKVATLRSMPRRLVSTHFTVQADGSLVSDQFLVARRRARSVDAVAPVPLRSAATHVAGILAALEAIGS